MRALCGYRRREGKSSNRAMGMVKGSQAVVVDVCDGGVSLGVLGEANKAETTAATGVTVLDDNLRLSVRVAWRWMKEHIRPLGPDRTLRTFDGECHRWCAKRGHHHR